MHFSTFIKLLTLDTAEKIRHLSPYKKQGGVDYYKGYRAAAQRLMSGNHTPSEARKLVERSVLPASIDANHNIFDAVVSWLSRQQGSYFAPARSLWTSPNRVFSVKIEPEIGIERGARKSVIAVYPRAEPPLNRDRAGAALLMLQQAQKGVGTTVFGILDAHRQKAFWSPTNLSSAVLDAEVATIESELVRLGR